MYANSMMIDANHMLRYNILSDGSGVEGEVVVVPGTQAMVREATHLFDLPRQSSLDELRMHAKTALRAYREG